jgi:DNA-binding transcriptional LysR family regulator
MRRHQSPQGSDIDFDLRQLEIFLHVVEMGSFSKAGKAVFLAQASVSERIASLERMVGTKLLDRLGRSVVPTKAGELLYKHAVRLLNMKGTACQEIQDFLGLKRGPLVMGGSTIPGEYILPTTIGNFRREYPQVTVLLTIGDSADIESRVLEGDLELGVIGFQSTQRGLLSRPLWKDELVLAIPAGHRWAARRTVTFEDLLGEPFILREPGSGTLKMMEAYFHSRTAEGIDSMKVAACFGSSTAVKEGIKAGLGISVLSARAVEAELRSGVLKTLRIKGLRMMRNFYLIRDQRREASPICQTMLDFLVRTAEQ